MNDCRIIGDQGSSDFWHLVKEACGSQIDILIDDGSHKAVHMLKTVKEGLKLLAPGGVIVVEDIDEIYNGRLVADIHAKYLMGEQGLHGRHSHVFANNLQRQLFSLTYYPHVLVVECMQQTRQRVKGASAGDIGMPQPPIGFNRWGYICAPRERGTKDCNNDGKLAFRGTTG